MPFTIQKTLLLLGCFFCLSAPAHSQQSPAFFFASRPCRDSVAQSLKTQVNRSIKRPLSDSAASALSDAYWAMELMGYQPAGFETAIPAQLQHLAQTDAELQRAFLEMLYALYPGQFAKEVQAIWPQLGSHKTKAMALEYLAQAGIFPSVAFTSSFYGSEWYLAYRKRWKDPKPPLPAVADFLHPSFLPGQAVLVSFQYADRNRPGYLMIRDTSGQWVADSLGKPLQFPQLARSVSNLPYYLTNGNTPQGLYRITGTAVSDNPWIGPTPNLQLVLPFESGNAFFGADTAYQAFYRKLLGPHLSKFTGLWESYTAGKVGRTEIIAHGTTIDPSFYKSKPYYPHTPSLGCLCSPETWNDRGERVSSAQWAWMSALQERKLNPQWLIVTEGR
ncbi:MAG: hypothetical protein KIPDCIKN_04273 [Haliscomenobacter sp.]|nr:hypothetical protein [Haliscomenobacter sp.]